MDEYLCYLGKDLGYMGLTTVFVLSGYLLPTAQSSAGTFRCLDDQGKSVLTDSPAQLQSCKPIDLNMKPDSTLPPSRKRTPVHRAPSRPEPQSAAPDSFEQEGQTKQPESELPIAVPLTKIGGSLVVQVLLNNTQSAHLIVDTGATMTVLSYDIGAELGLLSGSGVDLSNVNTAGGSVQVSMTKIDQIQVGQAKAENVQVAIHDLPDGISGVSGLLGMSFLKHFTVTLDSDRGFLYLTPRSNTE